MKKMAFKFFILLESPYSRLQPNLPSCTYWYCSINTVNLLNSEKLNILICIKFQISKFTVFCLPACHNNQLQYMYGSNFFQNKGNNNEFKKLPLFHFHCAMIFHLFFITYLLSSNCLHSQQIHGQIICLYLAICSYWN